MSNGDDSAQPEKLDPTALVVTTQPEPESVALSPTGLKTNGETAGVIDLQIPNLLPTDNVKVEREVEVQRTRIPVRITQINVHVIDNGYIVKLPQAGRQSDYGPDGSNHAFSDKASMLEFVGQVVGQVTYQYEESTIPMPRSATTKVRAVEDALEAGNDVVFEGFEPTMVVQG